MSIKIDREQIKGEGRMVKRVAVLGASFDTGNMGVSALAESTIKCILHKYPKAEITLLGTSRYRSTQDVKIGGTTYKIGNEPIKFSKNIFLRNHILRLYFYGFLFKIFRWQGFKNFFCKKNPTLDLVLNSDLVVDITGGDSFSDIYGFVRFFMGFLTKYLVLLYKKSLIFFPQTYGPFYKRKTRIMARILLSRAAACFSRDQEGIDYLHSLLNTKKYRGVIQLIPDVAITLEPEKHSENEISTFLKKKTSKTNVIGLNVSGLLYNGGYNKKNMFNLTVDYVKLTHAIIEYFLEKKDTLLILVPHVFPEKRLAVESDPVACENIYNSLDEKYKDRVFLPELKYNHREIKSLIGNADFFMGARMHSCIGALSQTIPTIGLAYSKKFKGVFKTINCENHVADMRSLNIDEIIKVIDESFNQKEKIREELGKIIPETKGKILNILDYVKL